MSESVTYVIVKGTFALLLLASIATWGLVLIKARQRWVFRWQDRRFLTAVGSPLKLAAIHRVENSRGPAWRVAQAGLADIADWETAGRDSQEAARDSLERALQSQIHQERRTAESGLAVLASIGTTAPFVGLFGTVWGIINALRAIGHAGSASLEVVAGPIGEALVATGVGIAVAVPAVLAYNYFLRQVKVHAADLEQFGSALIGAASRRPAKGAATPVGEPSKALRAERAPVGFVDQQRGEASV